jgi:peptide/nickel transport system permease protein
MLALAVGAPLVAPHDPATQYRDHLLAPPMPIRIVASDGSLRAPFFYPLRLVDRLERRFEEDRAHAVTLRWFQCGRAVAPGSPSEGPWLPLGADHLGRDVFSRLLYGARLSLAVAAAACAGALALGILLGALAGYRSGPVDGLIMRTAEIVLVLPVLYVVLAVRSALPLTMSQASVFALVAGLLVLLGWPVVARGVRGIVATERTRDYALAARAAGAGPARLLFRHLLPAASGFVRTQALLLVPAAVVAETTLSFVGLGFGADRPSWGTLLQEASDIRAIGEFPWLLSAAGAIVLLVLGVNLATAPDQRNGRV